MGANEHGHMHEGGPQSPTSLGTAGYDLYMTRSVRLYHGLFEFFLRFFDIVITFLSHYCVDALSSRRLADVY